MKSIMRKLWLGMIQFFLLILVEVQAISLTSTNFHHSFILVSLPHLPKFDSKSYSEYHGCIKKRLEGCEDKDNKEQYGVCVMRGFSSCMKRQSNMFEPEYLHAKDCKISCNNRVKGYSKFRFGFCLTECYKSHPSRHLNLVSSRTSLSLSTFA